MKSKLRKRLAVLMLLIFSIFSLAGCQLKRIRRPESDHLNESFSEPKSDQDKTPKQGNYLRLAVLKQDSWHPLEQDEAANLAVMSLVYRGLFMLDANEEVSLDLAESAAFSEDGLHLTIALRKDLSFSDGRQITARDCAESLNYYRAGQMLKLDPSLGVEERNLEIIDLPSRSDLDLIRELEEQQSKDELDQGSDQSDSELDQRPDAKSEQDSRDFESDQAASKADLMLPALPFRETDQDGLKAIQAINSIELLDKDILRINFNDYVPEIIYRLDFPILPAADLYNPELKFPATGSYEISQIYADSGIDLKSRDQTSLIKQIQVKVYANEDQMLKALTDDQVDLIYLRPGAYRNYSRRRDLRSLPKPGREYHLLLPGTRSGGLFTDPKIAKSFLGLWLRHPEYAERIVGLETAAFPLRPTDRLWSYLGAIDTSDLGQFSLDLTAKDDQVEIYLVAPDNQAILENCKLLRDMLFDLNLELVIQTYPEEDYPGIVKDGKYDLAYIVVDLDYPFDPISFYSQLAYYRNDFSMAMLERKAEVHRLADYQRLLLSVVAKQELNHDDLSRVAEDYFRLMTQVDFYGLGFSAEGLILSPRINEYFTPLPRDPYYYLKEINIWQSISP